MVVLNILFASIYIITGKFSLSLATVHVSASPVWPPTGIVLVAFMTFGYRIWPGVFLGAYIVNLTTAGNEITSLFIAGGNTLEGIIGAYLVGKYSGGQRVLDQPVGVFNFTILAAMVSTIVSPTIGVTSLALGGFARWEDLISIWYTWWLGDAAGNLIVAPLLLVWILNPRIVWSRRQFIEAILLFASLVLLCLVLFGDILHFLGKTYPVTFLCPLLLIIISFRFSQREAATSTALLAGISIWGTVNGSTLFVLETKNESLLLLQMFMSVNSVMALTVAAVVSGRREALNVLRQAHSELDYRVQERTASLSKAYGELQAEMAERKLSQEKLTLSQRQLSEAQQVAHLGSWEWDISRDRVTWSEELFRIFGIDNEDFSGTYEAYLDRVLPDDREYVRTVVQEAFTNHQPFSYEHRTILPGGVERVLLCRGKVVCDDGGRAVRMFGTAQDITERKKAEQALRESEERYRTVAETANDVIITIDRQSIVQFINYAVKNVFGYQPDEVIGQSLTMLMPDNFRELHLTALQRYVDTGKRHLLWENIEMQALRKDGTIFPVELSLGEFYLQGSHFFTGIMRDVSERKRAEESFRALLELAPDAMVIADHDGKISLVNSQTEKLFGYPKDEMLRQPVEMLLPRRFRGKHVSDRATYFGDPRVRPMGQGLELFGLRKDGAEFPVEISLSPIDSPNGTLAIAAIRDITERKRAEDQIARSQKELREYVDSMSTLSAKVAPDGTLLMVNKIAEVASGLPRDELMNVNFLEGQWWAFDPSVQARVKDAFRRAAAGESITYDEQLFAFGRPISIIFSLVPMLDENGCVRYIIAEGKDITAQKQAEDKFRALLESAPDAMVIADSDGRISILNSQAEAVFGYSRDEVLGKSVETLLPRRFRDKHVGDRASYFIDPRTRPMGAGLDLYGLRKDGSEFPVEISLSPIHTSQGTLVMAAIRDVTERKRTEEKIHLLGHTITSMNECVVITDMERRITFVNSAFRKIYGYSEEEALGKDISLLRPEDDPTMDLESIQIATLTGGWEGERLNVKKNGEKFPVRLSTSVVRARDGKPIAMVGIWRDITEYKRIEQELLRSAAIIESSEDAIIAKTLDGTIVSWNPAAERIYGYSAAEVKGRSIALIVPPNRPNEIAEILKKVERGESIQHYETVRMTKNGEQINISLTLSPIKNAAGKIIGASAIARDITERKRTEERVQMLGHTITSMNDCVVITDMQNMITFVNPAFLRTYGYKPEEILGKDISIVRPRNLSPELAERISIDTLQDGWHGEVANVRKNGEEFPIVLSTSVIHDRQGKPVSMVGISRDISERRRVQAAFRRWGQIFENAEFGIVIGGADGETVELMNPTFAQMHGYSVEEFTGSRFRDVFEPEEWDQFKKHLVAAREKGHHTFESKQLRKDGSSFPVMMDVTTVKDHAGKVMYHIIHVQDITERKQIEAQAKEAYRKEVLLKEIHHRVKNNLQMVSSMLSLQTTYIKDKKTLNVFTESQNRIRTITLIHEILYQSKDLGNIEMHNYFQTLVDSLVRSYRRNPSKIRQHIDAENVSLGIDTAIPCALIVNELVSNCLKHAFTASRGGSIWIDLQRSTDGAYCLKVRDNGIGFPGGLNYRATESLGLQLVMMFVEQLDADIRMTSRPGTAFMINFRESEYAERK